MYLIFLALRLGKGLMQTMVILRIHSNRNLQKAKGNACSPALLAGPLQTLCVLNRQSFQAIDIWKTRLHLYEQARDGQGIASDSGLES